MVYYFSCLLIWEFITIHDLTTYVHHSVHCLVMGRIHCIQQYTIWLTTHPDHIFQILKYVCAFLIVMVTIVIIVDIHSSTRTPLVTDSIWYYSLTYHVVTSGLVYSYFHTWCYVDNLLPLCWF